ncbi:MAG: methyltransferase domain-containing protein [Oscillospiraceae bacterium]|nr:methyltransferase domain-containing protein [Oscillospiraceae bacterium]
MNHYWSQYVQFTEELYGSRALKFHDGNKDLWLSALQVKDGMNVLEVGCGGGIFCHRIKTYLPGTKVTGLDFDIGHIEWANEKTAELNLDCAFVNGDATALLFEENTFDLCFSHTVMTFCEPNAFISEQYRVLKPGGIIVVLNVFGGGINPEMWKPDENSAEKELFDKVWAEADKNELSHVKKYALQLRDYPVYLEKAGFRNVKLEVIATATYNPDSHNVGEDAALEMINENRLSEMCSVQKARAMAPSALTDDEYNRLADLIDRRYDERVQKYKAGEKLWDFSAGMTVAISGVK